VTTAKRPSYRVRDKRKEATDLGSAPSGIFFAQQLDDPNQIESARQIRFFAHASSRLFFTSHATQHEHIVLILPDGQIDHLRQDVDKLDRD
jgi:hypothetical protein